MVSSPRPRPGPAVLLLLLVGCVYGDGVGAPGDTSAPAAAAAATSTAPLPEHPAALRHRGVSWVAGRRPVTGEDFATLVDARASWIVQTPFGWQEDERSPEVRLVTSGRVFWGESDEGLEVTTRLPRERGLRTLLKPHIWLRHAGDGAWRGDIAMETEEDWRRWFESYRRLALHYAAFAERLGMPAYCVGTELHAAARDRPDDWRRLIADVREVYSRQLTTPPTRPAGPVHRDRLREPLRRHAEPWLWPDRHGRREPSSPDGLELQARAYEAIFRRRRVPPGIRWPAGPGRRWRPRPEARGGSRRSRSGSSGRARSGSGQ